MPDALDKFQAFLKESFQAMPPPQQGQPQVDPNTGQPMDPAMMQGGAPPQVDPNTGQPMDPAMMGGAPPMDPSMGGGAPPMDPAQGGMPPDAMGQFEEMIQQLAGGMEQAVGQMEQQQQQIDQLGQVVQQIQQENMNLKAELEAMGKAWESPQPMPEAPAQDPTAMMGGGDPAAMGGMMM